MGSKNYANDSLPGAFARWFNEKVKKGEGRKLVPVVAETAFKAFTLAALFALFKNPAAHFTNWAGDKAKPVTDGLGEIIPESVKGVFAAPPALGK